jgi:ribosomal protein L29
MSTNAADYESDFYAWTAEQARLLRSGELSAIDAANIAEEIESMGRSDRREIKSRLIVLLCHLLKWRMQLEMQSTSWSGTIREQRRKIEELLSESPSLRPSVPEMLPPAYADAREDAIEETGLPETAFPEACPFTAEEVLSRTFLPEP